MKARVLFNIFVYVIAANVPVWIASRLIDFSLNGLFNIEYVAIGIVSLFVGQTLTICLLLSTMSIDLVYNIGKTYMLRPGELMASASSAPLYVGSHAGTIVAIASVIVLVCFLAVKSGSANWRSRERVCVASWLIAIACLGVAIDCSRNKVTALHADYDEGGFRLIRNGFHRVVMDQIGLKKGQDNSEAGIETISASRNLLEFTSAGGKVGDNVDPNIVFVVVESWGKNRSNTVEEALLTPYRSIELEHSYIVSTGTVPFNGGTVSGEMRELCGTKLGLGVISAPELRLKECLPGQIEKKGYHTVAVHGFEGTMFERASWYRKIHFEETWFRKQLLREGLPECPGPFPGICDAAIADWIQSRLQNAKEPQFIYWMTLNSHLPVPLVNMVKDPPSCSSVTILADDGICAWYRLIFNVHRSIAELAIKEEGKPTIFVVVGDHAPPFSSQNRRDQFSYTVVPYVVLWPKREPTKELRASRSAEVLRPFDRSRKASPKRGALRSSFGGD